MIDLAAQATIALAFFLVAVSPGPATLSNTAIAMKEGRKISLVYGFGMSTGLAFWGIIAASGMGAVLQASPVIFSILKIMGGSYFLWLAYVSYGSVVNFDVEHVSSKTLTKWFLQGALLNFTNPKSVLAWMVAFSLGLDADSSHLAIIAAFFVCVFVGIFVNAAYSIVFSMEGVMAVYGVYSRWVNVFMTVVFFMAGFGLFFSVEF